MAAWHGPTYQIIFRALVRALPQIDHGALHDAARDVMDSLPEKKPTTTSSPTVEVLLVWTDDLGAVKDALNADLMRLYEQGKIGDHPDGASEGWEWKG